MPLTLATPAEAYAFSGVNIVSFSIGLITGNAQIIVQILDANGNVVRTQTVQLSSAAATALGTALKTVLYNQVQTALGVTGTVT